MELKGFKREYAIFMATTIKKSIEIIGRNYSSSPHSDFFTYSKQYV